MTRYDTNQRDLWQGYDPEGDSIESLMNKLIGQQQMIASTLHEIKTVDGKTENNSSLIQQNADNILLRVTKTTYDTDINDATSGLKKRMTDAESSITQNADAIMLRVTKTTYDSDINAVDTGLKDRVTKAESSISLNSNEITLRVKKDNVISEINQTAETIKIQAGKIDLVGAVTVTDLNDETKAYFEKKKILSTTAPSDTSVLWFDSNYSPYIVKIYDPVSLTWKKATPSLASEVGAYDTATTDNKLATTESNANGYTDNKLTNYVTTTTHSSDVNNLQTQVDGKIESWFQTTDPAGNWTTATAREKHNGDMWYKSDSKLLYRYIYNSVDGTGTWNLVEDQKAIDAFNDASKAQDTADGKRRVFTATPAPPYDVGDLWTQGTTGDLMYCTTAKASGGLYDALDWTKASKYTDDTTANSNDTKLRDDLSLVSPLPTQITLDSNGITATADTGGYARLDYRGLYIFGGALQIDGGLPQSKLDTTLSSKVDNGDTAKSTIDSKGGLTYIDSSGIYVGTLKADQTKLGSTSSYEAGYNPVTKVNQGTLYSGVKIDSGGFTATATLANGTKIETFINSTDGIKIQKDVAGVKTVQMSIDTDGNAIFSGKISGGSIESDSTINIKTDATIGNKLHMNSANFGNGIKWGTVAEVYIDPAASALHLKSSGTIFANGNRVLTVADEGSGKGLDADTVDGYHASSFSLSSHSHDGTYVKDDNAKKIGLYISSSGNLGISFNGTYNGYIPITNWQGLY